MKVAIQTILNDALASIPTKITSIRWTGVKNSALNYCLYIQLLNYVYSKLIEFSSLFQSTVTTTCTR